MLIGWLLLLCPIAVFTVTLPFSRRLKPRLCMVYRIVGGMIVLGGSAISFYFAFYAGDQGGVTAFFFQINVIGVYVFFSVVIVWLNHASR